MSPVGRNRSLVAHTSRCGEGKSVHVGRLLACPRDSSVKKDKLAQMWREFGGGVGFVCANCTKYDI